MTTVNLNLIPVDETQLVLAAGDDTQLVLSAGDETQIVLSSVAISNGLMMTDGSNSALALGSAGTPSLKFAGDANTGIFSPGADQLSVTTGGTERLRIDSAGQIEAVSLGSAAAPTFSFTGDPNTGIYSPGADQLALSTGGTGRLFVASGGNVGIGTTAPGDILSVTGGNVALQSTGGAGAGDRPTERRLLRSDVGSVNGLAAIGMNGAGTSGFLGEIKFYTGTSDLFNTSLSERLRITSAGNVGIGTSTVQAGHTLQVNGIIASVTSFGAFTALQAAGGTGFRWALANDGTFRLQRTTDGFASAVTTPLMIDASSRVGIGTSSPGQLLHVNGNTFVGAAAAAQWSVLTVAGDAALAAAAPIFHFVNAAGSARFAYINHSGTGGDLLVLNQEAGALRLGTSNAERARIDSSGRLLVGTSTARANYYSSVTPGGIQIETGTQSLFQNSNNATGPAFYLGKSRGATVNSNTVVQADDQFGALVFFGADGTNVWPGAQITAAVDGTPGANDMPGRLVFSTTADGASSPTERMRINSFGSALLGKTVDDDSTLGTAIRPGIISIVRDGLVTLSLDRNTSDGNIVSLRRSGTVVGTISVTTTATAYNTSSDYRLKENVALLTNAIDRVNDLQVRRFNFIADPDKTVDGFLAHEAQAVVPECVTGTKDAVDDDGNPVYQGIDQSKLVPLLTAALQEAIAKIEVLESKVAALEAQ
jgi:hypothetical protein